MAVVQRFSTTPSDVRGWVSEPSNGRLGASNAKLGLEPVDEIEIKLGKKQLKLISMGGSPRYFPGPRWDCNFPQPRSTLLRDGLISFSSVDVDPGALSRVRAGAAWRHQGLGQDALLIGISPFQPCP